MTRQRSQYHMDDSAGGTAEGEPMTKESAASNEHAGNADSPEAVVASTLEMRIHLRGPIIVMDVPRVAEEVMAALRKAKADRDQLTQAATPPGRTPVVLATQTITANQSEADDAIELGNTILEMLNDLPSRADDFRSGVEESTQGIIATIEERHYVTANQWAALENMRAGVERWLDH